MDTENKSMDALEWCRRNSTYRGIRTTYIELGGAVPIAVLIAELSWIM